MKRQLEEGLAEFKDHYLDQVDELAAKVREEVIVPFCKNNNMKFIAGNGTYVFCRELDTANQDRSWAQHEWCDPDDGAKASEIAPLGWQLVLDVCNVEVPLWNGQSLGSVMLSYEGEGDVSQVE